MLSKNAGGVERKGQGGEGGGGRGGGGWAVMVFRFSEIDPHKSDGIRNQRWYAQSD